jgi:hypothetical protein
MSEGALEVSAGLVSSYDKPASVRICILFVCVTSNSTGIRSSMPPPTGAPYASFPLLAVAAPSTFSSPSMLASDSYWRIVDITRPSSLT